MYEVYGTVNQKVLIGNSEITKVLLWEKDKLLGGRDYYIVDGEVRYEQKYHTYHEETVRNATEEEIELDNALRLVIKHFIHKD